MYTLRHYQGRDMPIETELFENYEGEAREIILQSFIDEGMFTPVVYTMDDVSEEDIELEVSDWFNAYEIEQLKDLEQNAPESVWDTLTVQTLDQMLKMPSELKEVA